MSYEDNYLWHYPTSSEAFECAKWRKHDDGLVQPIKAISLFEERELSYRIEYLAGIPINEAE